MLKPAISRASTSYRASTEGWGASARGPSLRLRGCGPGSIQNSARSAEVGVSAPVGCTAGAQATIAARMTVASPNERHIKEEPSKDRACRVRTSQTRFDLSPSLAFSLHLQAPPAMSVRIPASTYRLQFNTRFTFRDAQAIADYLHCLGITDCYASSYLKAVPGSAHGYDVADPTQLNPEIGTREEYNAWIDALRSRAMGHVLDVVPNHMGIAKSSNPRWLAVLEDDPSSRFDAFFDIDW